MPETKPQQPKQSEKSFLSEEMQQRLEIEFEDVIDRYVRTTPEREEEIIRDRFEGDPQKRKEYIEKVKKERRNLYKDDGEMRKISELTNNFWSFLPGRGAAKAAFEDSPYQTKEQQLPSRQLVTDIENYIKGMSEEDQKILASMQDLQKYPDDDAKHKWFATIFPIYCAMRDMRKKEGWTPQQLELLHR